MRQVFCALTSAKLAGLVRRAARRVVLCAPAVRRDVADALIETRARLGEQAVRVTLDCDEDVFRLGYGEVEAARKLGAAKVDVRQCPGLRVGVVVVDDAAWVFTPTALYVQPEAHSDETPNALALDSACVVQLMRALFPEADATEAQEQPSEPEIGNTPLTPRTVERVEAALKIAPPIAFDVARQVRVFQPYIQYVDIHLKGCAVQRHRITIPKTIQEMGGGEELRDRLRTTFELIEKNSDLSSKTLEKGLRELLEIFTRPLGHPWGRVILRSARTDFDCAVKQFRAKIEEHKETVRKSLAEHLAESMDKVLTYYLPLAQRNPPKRLTAQVTAGKPTEADIRAWLLGELGPAFPALHDLVSEMSLTVQYRDVTYETLTEEGFESALRKAYPRVNWNKPFSEFSAAKEKEQVPGSAAS